MENHTLATKGDLDQVRMAVLQLAENLTLIHQPAPHNAAQFITFKSTIVNNLTSQLQQAPSVQVHDLLAEMTDQTRDLAHQIPLEMLETNVTALRSQVNDLQDQVNDLQGQVKGLQNQPQPALSSYVEHHIPRLNTMILGLQSQVAINVTPNIDSFNREIAHLHAQAASAGRISDRQTAEIAKLKDCVIDVVLLKRDLAALEDSMKAQQGIEKWLQTSHQTGAGQVEQGAGQASSQFPKGTPNITEAVLHHGAPLSPVNVEGKTPVSSTRASSHHNNTAMPSNRVPSNGVPSNGVPSNRVNNNHISDPAPLGNHHNIPPIAPSIINGAHRATYPRGLNPEAPSFVSRHSTTSLPTHEQQAANIKMASNNNEKKTVGDRPYDYKEAPDPGYKTEINESMWAQGHARSDRPGPSVSHAVPIISPEERNKAAFLAKYNELVKEHGYTAKEAADLIYTAAWGNVDFLSQK
ncbi:MAG: hypothetical protein Q9195_003035 [Heterodermia aff. obscurata]